MRAQLQLGDIGVDVVRKDIKNVHLSVYPPSGRVRIAAPRRMALDTVRVFAIAKLPWIRKQQRKLRAQEREPPREYVNRESHYVWGKRYLLKIVQCDRSPSVELEHGRMILNIRSSADTQKRHEVVEAWYRHQLRESALPLIEKWERVIGVKVGHLFVQRMKTKWGGCNHRAGTIRLNTDLAKKPEECLEYILVHEMIHLLEPTHNARFFAFMDQLMPRWQLRREALNRLPVRHEYWNY